MNELTCAIIKQINRLEFGSVKGIEMDKYLELKEKFEANRDDENAVKMAAYMRNLFSFYKKWKGDFYLWQLQRQKQNMDRFMVCKKTATRYSAAFRTQSRR